MLYSIPCPTCGRKISVPPEFLGHRLRCPICEVPFLAPLPTAGAEGSPPLSALAAAAAAVGENFGDAFAGLSARSAATTTATASAAAAAASPIIEARRRERLIPASGGGGSVTPSPLIDTTSPLAAPPRSIAPTSEAASSFDSPADRGATDPRDEGGGLAPPSPTWSASLSEIADASSAPSIPAPTPAREEPPARSAPAPAVAMPSPKAKRSRSTPKTRVWKQSSTSVLLETFGSLFTAPLEFARAFKQAYPKLTLAVIGAGMALVIFPIQQAMFREPRVDPLLEGVEVSQPAADAADVAAAALAADRFVVIAASREEARYAKFAFDGMVAKYGADKVLRVWIKSPKAEGDAALHDKVRNALRSLGIEQARLSVSGDTFDVIAAPLADLDPLAAKLKAPKATVKVEPANRTIRAQYP